MSHTSTVSELLRVAGRTVGWIIPRVVADARKAHDSFDGLRCISLAAFGFLTAYFLISIAAPSI